MTPQQIMSSVAQGLLAHAVGDAARYFLSGNDALLSRAMSALQLARDSYGNTGDIFNYTLASLLHETLPRTAKRSTWNVLGEILPNNYLWQRYLTLLSRGLGEDITTNTGIVELWPSQISALEHGLLQSESSFVAKMPTSAGKTRIAEMAMVHFLINNPELKCVYISPFRALSGELEQSLSGLFSDLGFKVSAAFGGFERDDSELDFLNESNVIITTPERLDYVLRVAPELYRQVGLVILDEGQLISDSTRGGHSENTITRIRRRRPETRFLTLSAVIADETLNQIGDWLGSEARVSSSSWRPTSQRVAKFTWRRNDGYLSFVESADDPFRTQGFVPRIAESKNYEYRNPSSGRIKREVFPSTDHKAKTAAELAFRLSKAGPVLVFCTQRNWVENVAEAFVQRIALMRLSGEDIPSRFSNFATLSSRLAEEWMGEDHIVSRALRYGVAIHHAALPEALRKAIERDFKSRLYQVIIATSTLAQGVNLPIKTVIMHSCMRANSDTNRMTSISTTEYWNIAGRAGRAVEETEGLVIQLCFTPQDSRLFEHYIKRRFDLTPLHSSLASWLIDIIENRKSSDELYRYLDADLLSHLVEEEVTDVTEEWVRSIFDSTFASATFRGDQEKLESCVLVLHQAFLDVTTRVPDHSRRVQYSSTGFSIESCEAIIDHITANEQVLRQVLVSNDPQEWRRTIPLFIAGCSNAWEVRIETNPTVDLALLADQWFRGTDYSSICSAFSLEATTKSYVSKLIEDFVSYRFAWGMSSYIRLCTANLAIDESELSDLARHFPSMMKYGVPNPQSVWCMNAGVPSRTIAMNLANGFIEDADPSTRHSLLSWLSKLSVEELRLRFHLDSVSLESTIDVVQRASPNLLVDLISRGDAVFPILTTVMLRSDLPAWINNSLKVGSLVEISRDYDLYISRNAVACFSGGELLGHSPTHIAQLIAPLMDSGQVFSATVTTTMSGLQNGRLSISIDKL